MPASLAKAVPPHLRAPSSSDEPLTSITNVKVEGSVSIIGEYNVRGRAPVKHRPQDSTPDGPEHFLPEVVVSNSTAAATESALSSAAGDVTNDTESIEKENSLLPPHRRVGKSPASSVTHHPYGEEEISMPEGKDELTSPVLTDDNQLETTHDQEASALPSADNLANATEIPGEKPVVATQPSAAPLASTGQAILLILGAIEVTGYLEAEGVAILHELRDKIIEQGTGALPTADSSDFHAAGNGQERDLLNPTEPIPDQATMSQSDSQSDEYFQKFPDLVAPVVEATANLPKLPARKYNKPSKYTIEEMLKIKSKVTKAEEEDDDDDREEQVYFSSWGNQEKRDAPGKSLRPSAWAHANLTTAARVRTVKITSLPANATTSFVTSLVFGGAIEYINLNSTKSASGDLTATVRFMKAEDCISYYDKTSNGVVYKKDAQNREVACFVKLAKDVDVVGGLLGNWVEQGVTRCVRAVGVDKDWSTEALKKMGERKSRKLEGIADTINPAGVRILTDLAHSAG